MAVEKEDSACGVCKKVVKSNQNGLKCEAFCFKWFHTKCIDISNDEYAMFNKLGDKALWFCSKCRVEVKSLPIQNNQDKSPCDADNLKLVLDELDLISKNFLELSQRVGKLETVNIGLKFGSEVNLGLDDKPSLTEELPPSDNCNLLEDKDLAGLSTNLFENAKPKSYSSVVQQEKLKLGDETNVLTRGIGLSLGDQASVAVISSSPNTAKVPTQEQKQLQEWKHVNRPTKKRISKGGQSSDVKTLKSNNRPSLGKSDRSAVLGTLKLQDSVLKSVEKKAWIFISRLATSVSLEQMEDHLRQCCQSEVVCEELTTKFPGYRSFRAGVPLEKKKDVLNPEVWPEGILVSDYVFNKKRAAPGQNVQGSRDGFLGRRPYLGSKT